ncbi:hypothetical protein RCL1_004504 [Eukaryota sp. TZLM3-RCL]
MFSLSHNPKLGNHLTSTSKINPGDNVFIECPLAFVPAFPLLHKRCDVCAKPAHNPLICPDCNLFCYCSSCSPLFHSTSECEVLKYFHHLPSDDGYSSLMLLRLALRIISLPPESSHLIHSFCSASPIPDHKLSHYSQLKELLINLGSSDFDISLFSRIELNSHDVPDIDFTTQSSGMALYPHGRLLTHSCTPNTSACTKTGSFCLTCLSDVLPNEPLTITYVDNLKCFHERSFDLESRYGFICECEGCLGNKVLPNCTVFCPVCVERSERDEEKDEGEFTVFELHGSEYECRRCESSQELIVSSLQSKINQILSSFSSGVSKFTADPARSFYDFSSVLYQVDGFPGKKGKKILTQNNSITISTIPYFIQSVIDNKVIQLEKKKELLDWCFVVISPFLQYSPSTATQIYQYYYAWLKQVDASSTRCGEAVAAAVFYAKMYGGVDEEQRVLALLRSVD